MTSWMTARRLAFLCLLTVADGCGKEASSVAVESATPSSHKEATVGGATTPSKNSATATVKAASGTESAKRTTRTKIDVKTVDLQLLHPFSAKRGLRRLNGEKELDHAKRRSSFGLGMLIEATNSGSNLLEKPRIRGRLRFQLGDGRTVGCDFAERRAGKENAWLARNDRGKGAKWRVELKHDTESPWRPKEVIRLGIRQNCAPAHIVDLNPTAISVTFEVIANIAADGDVVRSSEIKHALTPDLLAAVGVKVGDQGWLAGNVAVSVQDGKWFRNDLSQLGISLHDGKLLELPKAPAGRSGKAGQISWSMEVASLLHWTEVPELPKGERQLIVKLTVTKKSERLSLPEYGRFTKSATTLKEAEESVQEANRLVEVAEAKPADASDRRAAVRAAQKTLGEAKKRRRQVALKVRDDERSLQKVLKEAGREILRTLPMHRAVLVTTKTTRKLQDAAEVRTRLEAFAEVTTASIDLKWRLSRYEVPIAINWIEDDRPKHFVVASRQLTTFDPR